MSASFFNAILLVVCDKILHSLRLSTVVIVFGDIFFKVISQYHQCQLSTVLSGSLILRVILEFVNSNRFLHIGIWVSVVVPSNFFVP